MKIIKTIYGVWSIIIYLITALIIFPLFFILHTLFDDVKAHRYVLKVVKAWAFVWGVLCGIRFKAIDRHKIPPNQSYVFVCNHQSNLDSMLWGYVNIYQVKGLAKKELLKVPVVGYLFKKTCVIIDRQDKESRKQGSETLQKYVDQNVSIFIFPEGTRNKTKEPLQPFYDGAFRMAIDMQQPIAPLVMCNSGLLAPPGTLAFRPGTCKCVFLDPVPTKGLTRDDVPALKEKVFEKMKQAVIQHDDRFKHLA